jgi:hypothetical protein
MQPKKAGALQVMAFEITDGMVAGIYVVRNPDKLVRLATPADRA